MHTVRGKQKMIREIERDEFEDRKKHNATEHQTRKDLFFLMKRHEEAQLDKLRAQSELSDIETHHRSQLCLEVGSQYAAIYNNCNQSILFYLEKQESRMRGELYQSQSHHIGFLARSSSLQQEEHFSRVNHFHEHQQGISYIYDCACVSTVVNLTLEESTYREVIQQGEEKSIASILYECWKDEMTTDLAIHESAARRAIRANESYEADEIYLAACGGRVQHCKHSEACKRGDIESEQSTSVFALYRMMNYEQRVIQLVASEASSRARHNLEYHTTTLNACLHSQRLSEFVITASEQYEFDHLSRLFSDESARQYFIHDTEYMARCNVVHEFWVDLVSAFNIWDAERTNILLNQETEVRDMIIEQEDESRLQLLLVKDSIHIMEDELAERECIQTISFENMMELCHLMFDERFAFLEASGYEYRSLIESSEMSQRHELAVTSFGRIAATMLVECEEESRYKIELKFVEIYNRIKEAMESETSFLIESAEDEGRQEILTAQIEMVHQLYHMYEVEGGILHIAQIECHNRSLIIEEERSIAIEAFCFKEQLYRSSIIELNNLLKHELRGFFMSKGIIKTEEAVRSLGIAEELSERRYLVEAGEWLQRSHIEMMSSEFWFSIYSTKSLLASMVTFHMACEATAQDILNEESRSWDTIMTSHYEESKSLFEYIEEFRALKQHFNDKQVILSQGKWELPEGMERKCAGNPQFFNLLRHAIYLCDATEYHYKSMLDRSYSDIGRLRAELSSSKAEVSRTREELKETDAHLRLESSNRIKLQASFKTVKDKCEQLDRERRSTSSANEKTRLEKRIRDLELQLHATQNALEKERSRSTRRR
eukprot:TRINITY_DN19345_c0_g1_i1.p1 TRINITY_DN19345_c0_g1~~TRINITY_DN19345_c0_g1_i1.p1  ORF type:complete len:979 (+),score=190.53 TRINITY_DN19345_c0_g1_i1:441-2939(+)